MKKIIYILLFAMVFPHLCSAQSLDEIYRDIVKSENEGYLPLFVKNRQAPDFLAEESAQDAPTAQSNSATKDTAPINLINKRQIANDAKNSEVKKWQNTIEAIKLNQVTPVELHIVESRVAENDPKATEIYAWMLARGVGIEQNLIKAFNMYQRAALLQVPDAEKNAVIVYRAMSPDQRAQIKPLNGLEEHNS